MGRDHFILMGDIVDSRDYEGDSLMAHFLELITGCNKSLKDEILSPYTVTLGDEFQGVAKTFSGALEAIYYLEEERLHRGFDFLIRYVLYQGVIETPLNPDNAHEMLGPGLTAARELLSHKSKERPRFQIVVKNTRWQESAMSLFRVIDTLIGKWKPDDYPLVYHMINEPNNQEVGDEHNMHRSQVWKRRKTLMVSEYLDLKSLSFELAEAYRD